MHRPRSSGEAQTLTAHVYAQLPAAAAVTLWPQTAGKAMAINNFDPATPRDYVETIKKSEKLDKVVSRLNLL